MMRRYAPVLGLLTISACGDPLAGIEDVSDVTLAENPTVAVVPVEAEVNRKQSVLSGRWRQPNDVAPAAEAPAAEVRVTEPEAPTETAPTETAPAQSAAVSETAEPEPQSALAENAAEQATVPVLASTPKVPAKKRNGLVSWLAAQGPKTTDEADVPVLVPDPAKVTVLTEPVEEASFETKSPEQDVHLASVTSDVAPARQNKPKRNARTPRRPAANSPDVPFGAVLPFGDVGRVCAAKSQPLGKKVETSEGRGQVYSLYDSAPGSTAPRTFYVTGFDDKCPRQFTAALALFGAPELHEQLRYGRPAVTYPYSATDKAYENIKAQICGVGPRKPCGAKIEKLSRDTVFISTYEKFTDNGRWADLLVHDGAVVAAALKAPGQRTQ